MRAPKTKQVNLRISEEDRALFQHAAAAAGIDLSTWLTLAGLQMAGQHALAEQLAGVHGLTRKHKRR